MSATYQAVDHMSQPTSRVAVSYIEMVRQGTKTARVIAILSKVSIRPSPHHIGHTLSKPICTNHLNISRYLTDVSYSHIQLPSGLPPAEFKLDNGHIASSEYLY